MAPPPSKFGRWTEEDRLFIYKTFCKNGERYKDTYMALVEMEDRGESHLTKSVPRRANGDHRFIRDTVKRIEKRRDMKDDRAKTQKRLRRTEANTQVLLAKSKEDHKLSTRELARQTNMDHMSVYRTLKEAGMKSISPQIICGAGVAHKYVERKVKCQALLNALESGQLDLKTIIFSDEVWIACRKYPNRQRTQFWVKSRADIS